MQKLFVIRKRLGHDCVPQNLQSVHPADELLADGAFVQQCKCCFMQPELRLPDCNLGHAGQGIGNMWKSV